MFVNTTVDFTVKTTVENTNKDNNSKTGATVTLTRNQIDTIDHTRAAVACDCGWGAVTERQGVVQ